MWIFIFLMVVSCNGLLTSQQQNNFETKEEKQGCCPWFWDIGADVDRDIADIRRGPVSEGFRNIIRKIALARSQTEQAVSPGAQQNRRAAAYVAEPRVETMGSSSHANDLQVCNNGAKSSSSLFS